MVKEGNDVITNAIQEVIKQKLCVGSPKEIEKKLVHKIHQTLLLHKAQWFRPSLPGVATLSWPYLELRIQIPWSKYLLRLIFRQHQDSLIIFSGHIIKPERYEDKKTTMITKLQYEKEIENCKWISIDFFWPKKNKYQPLYTI